MTMTPAEFLNKLNGPWVDGTHSIRASDGRTVAVPILEGVSPVISLTPDVWAFVIKQHDPEAQALLARVGVEVPVRATAYECPGCGWSDNDCSCPKPASIPVTPEPTMGERKDKCGFCGRITAKDGDGATRATIAGRWCFREMQSLSDNPRHVQSSSEDCLRATAAQRDEALRELAELKARRVSEWIEVRVVPEAYGLNRYRIEFQDANGRRDAGEFEEIPFDEGRNFRIPLTAPNAEAFEAMREALHTIADATSDPYAVLTGHIRDVNTVALNALRKTDASKPPDHCRLPNCITGKATYMTDEGCQGASDVLTAADVERIAGDVFTARVEAARAWLDKKRERILHGDMPSRGATLDWIGSGIALLNLLLPKGGSDVG